MKNVRGTLPSSPPPRSPNCYAIGGYKLLSSLKQGGHIMKTCRMVWYFRFSRTVQFRKNGAYEYIALTRRFDDQQFYDPPSRYLDFKTACYILPEIASKTLIFEAILVNSMKFVIAQSFFLWPTTFFMKIFVTLPFSFVMTPYLEANDSLLTSTRIRLCSRHFCHGIFVTH